MMWFRRDSRSSAAEKAKLKRKKVPLAKSGKSDNKSHESVESQKDIVKRDEEDVKFSVDKKEETHEEAQKINNDKAYSNDNAIDASIENAESNIQLHENVIERSSEAKNADVGFEIIANDFNDHVDGVIVNGKETIIDLIYRLHHPQNDESKLDVAEVQEVETSEESGDVHDEIDSSKELAVFEDAEAECVFKDEDPVKVEDNEDVQENGSFDVVIPTTVHNFGQESEDEEPSAAVCDTIQAPDKTEAAVPDVIVQPEAGDTDTERHDDFDQNNSQSMAIVLTDSECAPEKKKPKTKHRKTMSMSSTIELVKCLGDEWIEAAKREIEEHSRKKEHSKKKDKDHHESEKQKNNDMVALILYDASVGETDDFEVLDETEFNSKKHPKKKDSKENKEGREGKDANKHRKISAVSMMNAQKNTVKKIAKASSVTAFNFIRNKKKPLAVISGQVVNSSIDHTILSTEILLEHERRHTNMVQDPKAHNFETVGKDSQDESKSASCDDDEEEIYYDAKSDPVDDALPKIDDQNTGLRGLRGRRTIGGSLKRTGGGRRRAKKRSAADEEAPPLPPRAPLTNSHPPALVRQSTPHQKHSHWLFGSSFKGESKRDEDAGADTVSQMTDSSHLSSEHSADRTDNIAQSRGGSAIAARPVTRAESYRDRADRVKRTKRKTSVPNQLTSSKDYHDAEVVGGAASGPGAPSGGSSNSSLSSRSNDSAQPENHGSQSEWSEEEDCGGPWSARATPELIASMSGGARKRQDLIHELIWSESSHVRWLRVLRRVYHLPLLRAAASLLPAAELRALLPNLPDVLQRHRRLAAELRGLQQAHPRVPTGPLADALISMLGEGRYAAALARFCGGQGLALDALKERRKRNKELNSFLTRAEQDPLCARLTLRDLLACVWQRLTKYQLLLEGIVKTSRALDDENSETEGATNLEDFAKVSHALELAKDVLNTVNTAIKTTENEHRLKTIQSKLEIRGAGGAKASDVGNELRQLDLARHNLIMEGSLSIRQDSNKRVNVLALLLKECLVLLHTDGERYILRPIPQTTHQPLSPVVQWSAVFFRPNAAVENGFFLVNINGSQMYELSTASTTEYNTWRKHLYEAATALEPRPGIIEDVTTPFIPPSPNPTVATAESVPNGAPDPEPTNEEEPTPPENEDDGNHVNGALATVVSEEEAGISSASTQDPASCLLEPTNLTITQPPLTQVATLTVTPRERLRRAEEKVALAMMEALEAAEEVSGNSSLMKNAAHILLEANPTSDSTEKLLLTAQDHVNKLTEVLLRSLRVSPSECPMTRCSVHTDAGLCDACAALCESSGSTEEKDKDMDSIVILEEAGESSTDPTNEADVSVVGSSGAGLRSIVAELLGRLPDLEREREVLRSKLQQAENRIHLLHQLHKDCNHSEDSPGQETCDDVAVINSSDKGSGNG